MSNQIQVKWNSGMAQEDFQASLEAVKRFPNRDAITVSVGIKGELTEGDLAEVMRIADRSESEIRVTLTATFKDGKQLRLFGPGPSPQADMFPVDDRVQSEADDILEAAE